MGFDSAIPKSLGADLRALRRNRGFTLSDLSERLGKSVGWLSQVERDISEPGISELRELAGALDVPMSLFFGQSAASAGEEGRVVRAETRRPLGSRHAGLVEQLLSPDLTDDFEVIHSVFEPQSELPEPGQRDTQEVGYLVSGRLNLTIGDQSYELNPGDSFRIRGEAYRWSNPHSKPAVAIWVISPPVY